MSIGLLPSSNRASHVPDVQQVPLYNAHALQIHTHTKIRYSIYKLQHVARDYSQAAAKWKMKYKKIYNNIPEVK
jgi:hypothetical protein